MKLATLFVALALLPIAAPRQQQARLVETQPLKEGAASQGVALAKDFYYGSTSRTICRFDTDWKFIEQKTIQVAGVNHIGAIHYDAGFLWVGLLHGPVKGKHDPKLDRAIVAKVRARDLEVVDAWDLSKDVTWIDPVCFAAKRLWVGDLSDLGIHRYKLVDGELVRDGIFRYPKAMHFSQGIRIVGDKLYSTHTFGTMDGLFEFQLPAKLDGSIQQPRRVWPIQERRSHLEGFAFVPGRPNEIWHAQGSEVDRYVLEGLKADDRQR